MDIAEKVTRETAVEVTQDTAYLDLKEKMRQLENNADRLRQNILEVQMQHETISEQYQDELRLRPEALARLSSIREICDVCEESIERLKASLSRCRADQETLTAAYNKSGQVVRDIVGQQIQAEEKRQRLIQNLQQKLKLVTEHKKEMVLLFVSAKEHLESELNDARAKLATTLGQKDELFVALNDFSRKVDHFEYVLEKKDKNIASLRVDIKELVNKYSNEAMHMKNLLMKKEKDLKEFSDANKTLKKALQNQDQCSKPSCEQNNQLQENIYSLEQEQIALSDKLKEAEKRFEEANAQLLKEIEKITEKNKELRKVVADKKMVRTMIEDKLLAQAEIEHQNMKANMSSLETEKSQVVAKLKEVTLESDLKSDKNKKLVSVNQNLKAKLAEMKCVLEILKIEHSNQINELHMVLESKDKAIEIKDKAIEIKDKAIEIKDKAIEIKDKAIEIKDKELDCKATTINQMMSDLKNMADANSKLEKETKDMEVEKLNENVTALTGYNIQLNISVKNKKDELPKQMATTLDTRNEKKSAFANSVVTASDKGKRSFCQGKRTDNNDNKRKREE